MPYFDHDGVQIYYEVHGAQDRTPLVLSHCLAGHPGLWSDNVTAVSAVRPLVVWDCRGHGRSSVPADPAS